MNLKDQKEIKQETLDSLDRWFENFDLDRIKIKRVFDEKNKSTHKFDYILSFSKNKTKEQMDEIINELSKIDVNEKNSANALLDVSAKIIHLSNLISSKPSQQQ